MGDRSYTFSLKGLFKWHRGGLTRRFFSYMILLIIILMGGVFIVVEKNNRTVILMEGKKRGISNTMYLAALSTAPLLMYDYVKLEQNVDEVAKEPDVVYAIIADKNGSVVAHSRSDDLIGKVLKDPISRKAAGSYSQIVQDYCEPETGEDIWDIAYPIFLQQDIKWGTVRIGFSRKTLMAEIAQNRRDLILLSLAAVLLTCGAASLLAGRISGPIRKLSEGALSISRGNLDQQISINTGDEIEELSKTFNRMTRELSKNRNQQKRLIEQLSRNNLLLKKEIAAREQLEDELIKAERLRALGEMSGGVAHDFNNILGAILGRAQLLLEKIDDPLSRRGIQVIEKAAMDGAETVRRIQEFTRVRADSSSFIRSDINEVIRDAVEFTRTRWKNEAEAWGISIDMQYELGDLPPMMGDPSGLREVFTNLIINAVDAMPRGGSIRILTSREGDMAEVKVIDTGIGMSAEVQKRTFDPFFTTKGTRGSGLGLSICYGIISRHKGEISLESREGEGSTFSIKLPMNLPGRDEVTAQVSERGVIPARVLVIDDDKMMRAVLSDILKQSDCSVDAAGSGSEGLELFSSKEFDIVLTDLGMEDMSGWEVAAQIKRRSPFTPIALITGWGTQLDEGEAHNRGVDFVVSKPFRIEELRNLVNRAMALKKQKRE